MTRVVHCKREQSDVYIGRPSKWGNPYTIGKDEGDERLFKMAQTQIDNFVK